MWSRSSRRGHTAARSCCTRSTIWWRPASGQDVLGQRRYEMSQSPRACSLLPPAGGGWEGGQHGPSVPPSLVLLGFPPPCLPPLGGGKDGAVCAQHRGVALSVR